MTDIGFWVMIAVLESHPSEEACRVRLPIAIEYAAEHGDEDVIFSCVPASLAPTEVLRPTLRPKWNAL